MNNPEKPQPLTDAELDKYRTWDGRRSLGCQNGWTEAAVQRLIATIDCWMRACNECDGGAEFEPCREPAVEAFCAKHLDADRQQIAALESRIAAGLALCDEWMGGNANVGSATTFIAIHAAILREGEA